MLIYKKTTYVGMKLTEIEKTILMSFYILSKGSTRRYIDKDIFLEKFPTRQRKTIRRYINRLRNKGLIKKHRRENKYRLDKGGINEIAKFISNGVKLRL